MIPFLNAWLLGMSLFCALATFYNEKYAVLWIQAATWFLIGGLAA